jgi:hypothetical protein
VLGTISTDRSHTLTRLGHSLPSALTGGYQDAFVVAGGCAMAAFLLALVLLRQPRGRQAEPVRERIDGRAAAEA